MHGRFWLILRSLVSSDLGTSELLDCVFTFCDIISRLDDGEKFQKVSQFTKGWRLVQSWVSCI